MGMKVFLLFPCKPNLHDLFALILKFTNWLLFHDSNTVDNPITLYLISTMTRFGILEVKDIERPILLISKFGTGIGATCYGASWGEV